MAIHLRHQVMRHEEKVRDFEEDERKRSVPRRSLREQVHHLRHNNEEMVDDERRPRRTLLLLVAAQVVPT